jgi:dihydroneopterin aldolase
VKDKIKLREMIFYGFHGVSPQEKQTGQRFSIDLEVECDLSAAGLSDDPEDTVNYSKMFKVVKAIVEGPSRNLLEHVAESVAQAILKDFGVESARVVVRKPEVPIKSSILSYAAVEIYRTRDQ